MPDTSTASHCSYSSKIQVGVATTRSCQLFRMTTHSTQFSNLFLPFKNFQSKTKKIGGLENLQECQKDHNVHISRMKAAQSLTFSEPPTSLQVLTFDIRSKSAADCRCSLDDDSKVPRATFEIQKKLN